MESEDTFCSRFSRCCQNKGVEQEPTPMDNSSIGSRISVKTTASQKEAVKRINVVERVIIGESITRRGRHIQVVKIVILTLIPIIVLMFETSQVVVKSAITSASSINVNKLIKETAAFRTVLHALQNERSIMELYDGTSLDHQEEVLHFRTATDRAISRMRVWPSEDKIGFTRLALLNELVSHRLAEDMGKQTNNSEVYTAMVERIVGWIRSVGDSVHSKRILERLIAYYNLIMAREESSLVQGLGSRYFINGYVEHDQYVDITSKSVMANDYLEICAAYSNHLCRPELKKLQNHTIHQMVQDLKKSIFMKATIVDNEKEALNWHSQNEVFLEAVYQIEILLADDVVDMVNKETRDSQKALISSIAVLCISICIAPCSVVVIVHSFMAIQAYANELQGKSLELTVQQEKSKKLLYRLLPKVVVDKLGNQENVAPEFYDNVSIFFSDVVGFTKICSVSSPLQVVDMLNYLYMTFDKRIDLYDVYKVETIGDAYMVVSGCPHRNGRRHCTEIAAMSLDLMERIGEADLPHIPGQKLRLRIGIHSDFSYLEQEANKIHVSEATFECMKPENFGGFLLKKRGLIEIKGKGVVLTYWLVGQSDNNKRKSVPKAKVLTRDDISITYSFDD